MKVNKRFMSIGEAANYLEVSVMTLRRWDASGKLKAIRMPSGHRYYEREVLEIFREDIIGLAKVWSGSHLAPKIPENYYSETQDRFRARLEHMAILANREQNPNLVPLIAAVAGEIGNNSFDHNLGNWPDMPGVFFAWDVNKRIVVLADRGVGIRATLARVRAGLKNDLEALTVAMTERISGRSPERRGNGLKFLVEVATENPIGISLQSGTATAIINKEKGQLKISLADRNIRGVLAKIEY